MVQAPENILTVLRALKLPSGPHASAIFNALLDHGHVEKLALVEVPPTPLRSHAAPAAHGNCPPVGYKALCEAEEMALFDGWQLALWVFRFTPMPCGKPRVA